MKLILLCLLLQKTFQAFGINIRTLRQQLSDEAYNNQIILIEQNDTNPELWKDIKKGDPEYMRIDYRNKFNGNIIEDNYLKTLNLLLKQLNSEVWFLIDLNKRGLKDYATIIVEEKITLLDDIVENKQYIRFDDLITFFGKDAKKEYSENEIGLILDKTEHQSENYKILLSGKASCYNKIKERTKDIPMNADDRNLTIFKSCDKQYDCYIFKFAIDLYDLYKLNKKDVANKLSDLQETFYFKVRATYDVMKKYLSKI